MPVDQVRMPNGETVAAQRVAGSSADVEKQQQILAEEAAKGKEERIAKAAEYFNAMHKAYARDHMLSEDEVVAAMFLENLNCREFYPEELGGTEEYDRVTGEILAWFEANKDKD
jgi:hypothetical protein